MIMKLNALQAGFNLDHIVLESPYPNNLANFYKEIIKMEFVKKNKISCLLKGKATLIAITNGDLIVDSLSY